MTGPSLHHALVAEGGAAPSRWMLVLHGIFGSGGNFRTMAKRLAGACPSWGFVLVDLRGHGQSLEAPPPSTLASVAGDLVRLEDALPGPVCGVMGHSFGGKSALAYAGARARAGAPALDVAWILDASPSARPAAARAGQVLEVLALLEAMPARIPSRERFLADGMEKGCSRAVAEWLAMNVRRDGDAFRLRVDLRVMRDLVESHLATDLWDVVEDPRAARRLGFVIGGRSEAWSEGDRARLAALAALSPRCEAHVFEEAGHWVHVDAPDALFAVVRASLE